MKPEFISAQKEGSFALLTITKRLPYIVDQIILNNKLDEKQIAALEKLKSEIPYENFKMPEIIDDDFEYWKDFMKIHNKSWIEEPFMVVEFYLYRRIMEATGYFSNKLDPFKYTKLDSLHGKINEIITIANKLNEINRPLRELLIYNLWGNRADLSQFNQPGTYLTGGNESNMVINDVDRVISLFEKNLDQVDILLDNSGLELSMDLIMVYYLLEEKIAKRLYLHTKNYPIFVSDALPEDIMYTIEYFKGSGDSVLKNIGEKLSSYIHKKTIMIDTDPFWTLPEPFANFNPRLRKHFSKSDLVISKGDLNYRRLVEDRYWDYIADIKDVIEYFPANVLIIRALKSELMLGATEENVKRLFNEDPEWLVNGKFGMIQLIEK